MSKFEFGGLSNRFITFFFTKTFVISILAVIYVLAHIISPYWLMPLSNIGEILVLFLIIILGLLWCYFSSDQFVIRVDIHQILIFFVLLILVIFINFQSLRYDIPWRGDEDYHITKTLWIVNQISPMWVSNYLLILILFLFISWKQPKLTGIFGGIILVGIIIFTFRQDFFDKSPNFFLRYPFVNYWFFSIIPIFVTPTYQYHEFLFRVIPILSVVALTANTIQRLELTNLPAVFMWGLAIVTIPIVFYYSSILYLELTASFLMLIVSLNIKSLLYDSFEQIRKSPPWYALILIGFIKETTISFLLCFLICRFVIMFIRIKSIDAQQVEKHARELKIYIIKDMVIFMSILLPLILYLCLRSVFADVRSFNPDLLSLLNFSVYKTLIKAFVEQFGLFFIIFLIGCGLLFLRKEYSTVFFYGLTFLFIPLFHATDNIAFTGYSRFNLFLLPIVLAGATVVIKKLMIEIKFFGFLTACLIILVNLCITPVYPDGSKQPFWGNYFTDTSEHYYPYQDSLTWLKKNYYYSRILFVSGYYPYYFEFYFNQINWHPRSRFLPVNFERGAEINALSKVFKEAGTDLFDVVLYQVIENNTLLPENIDCYHLINVITNDAGKKLAIYVR